MKRTQIDTAAPIRDRPSTHTWNHFLHTGKLIFRWLSLFSDVDVPGHDNSRLERQQMGVLHRRGSRGPVELYDSICKYLPQTRVESGFHSRAHGDTFRALIYSFQYSVGSATLW